MPYRVIYRAFYLNAAVGYLSEVSCGRDSRHGALGILGTALESCLKCAFTARCRF